MEAVSYGLERGKLEIHQIRISNYLEDIRALYFGVSEIYSNVKLIQHSFEIISHFLYKNIWDFQILVTFLLQMLI